MHLSLGNSENTKEHGTASKLTARKTFLSVLTFFFPVLTFFSGALKKQIYAPFSPAQSAGDFYWDPGVSVPPSSPLGSEGGKGTRGLMRENQKHKVFEL